MVAIGIVGHANNKFTIEMEEIARNEIRVLLKRDDVTVLISGGCHLGGIDVWAEEIAKEFKIPVKIFKPDVTQWNPENKYGYRERNIDIASNSDELYNIVVEKYKEDFKGMKYAYCYHCNDLRPNHVKSGGCWTANRFEKIKGKKANWIIIKK